MKVGMNFNPQLTVHNSLTPKPNSPTLIYLFYQVPQLGNLFLYHYLRIGHSFLRSYLRIGLSVFSVVISYLGNHYLYQLSSYWAIIFCLAIVVFGSFNAALRNPI